MSPVARYWNGTAWTDIGTLLPGSLPFEPWHEVGAVGEPAFATGVSNYGAPYNTLAFRKTPEGKVQLKGLFKISAAASGPLFTLPAGYRPSGTIQLTGHMFKAASPGGGLAMYVTVTAAGAVSGGANLNNVGIGPPWDFASVEGLEFPTDQATWPSGPAGGASASRVTSLPAGPYDGQEVVYVADATAGVLWRLRYNAGSASAYKWEFIGGTPLTAEQATTFNNATTTHNDTGLTITAPLAGDYIVGYGADQMDNTGTGYCFFGLMLGGVEYPDYLVLYSTSGAGVAPGWSSRRHNALAAAAVIKGRGWMGGAGTARLIRQKIEIRPVRVG